MLPDWKSFLETQGASIRDHEVLEFPDRVPSDHRLADLSERGLLAVIGPDAGKFLQGQLTCNVDELSLEHSSLGACCTNKGRMVASFRILRAADGYLLEMHRGLIEPLIEHLKKFIVFFKAEMHDASDSLVRLGCIGTLGTSIAEATGSLPETINQVGERDGTFVIRLHGAPARYEIWTPPKNATRIWQALAEVATPVSWNQWMLEEIRAGIGFVAPETREAFTPQMLNYQLLDAISFTKGCYTGQEIVARTQYRGAIKRHMMRLEAQTRSHVPAGTPVLDEEQKQIGEVVCAALTATGTAELLAVLHEGALDQTGLTLDLPDQPGASLLGLPYSSINE